MPLSESEFNEIAERYGTLVYQRALAMLGRRDEAEDVTQDVFLHVSQRPGPKLGVEEMAAYLTTATTNECRQTRRQSRRRQPLPESDPPKDFPVHAGVEEELAEEDQREYIHRCVSKLTDREAQAVTLFYFEGRPYAEVARIMNIATGTVASLLSRGRGHLHILLRGKIGERVK